MTFLSATAATRIPLLPRPAVYRPLAGVWRAMDWYAQETMQASNVRDARSIATDRWNGPGVACLERRVRQLARGQVEPVALRLAAIGVSCGWPSVVSEGGSVPYGVPDRFAALWAAVAQRIGTVRFGAVPLLAVVNHTATATATASAGEAFQPVLTWADAEESSRIDLLLATAARIDAVNASVLLKSHLLEYAGARPMTAVRGLHRVVRVQSVVHQVLQRRLEAMADTGCTPSGITAALTLAADAPGVRDRIPPRLVTPVQQAVEAMLGMRQLDSGLVSRPRARRHLGREQAQAVVAFDQIGQQVRSLAHACTEVGAAYDEAVASVRHSNVLYRRLIDAAVQPANVRGRAPGSRPSVI